MKFPSYASLQISTVGVYVRSACETDTDFVPTTLAGSHWVRDNPNVKNLRVYGAHNVVNEHTTFLVARAFKNKNIAKLTPWPGASFDMDTEEGQALLGAPIGTTMAHLLAGHKAELGLKHISKVYIITNDYPPGFSDSKRKEMHIFYTIEDVPTDKDEPVDNA
jgi:hypothetical protein